MCTALLVIQNWLQKEVPFSLCWIKSRCSSFLLKAHCLCYLWGLHSLVGVGSEVSVSQLLGIQQGATACVGSFVFPGWAESHMAPELKSFFCLQSVFIANTHPNTPTCINSCLCNGISFVISLHAAACYPFITFWLNLLFSFPPCGVCFQGQYMYERCNDSRSKALRN